MLLFTNANILRPGRAPEKGHILIVEGGIAAIGASALNHPAASQAKTIDASGLMAAPGLIDLHVHLRQPGQEYKETIASGTRAAAAGGFTAVCPMANTSPVNDSPEITRFILETARKEGFCQVYPVASLSQGLKGENLSEMAALKEAGAMAFSDDGRPLANTRLFRRALEYAGGLGMPVFCHSEDMALSAGGVMHEGAVSARLGLAGIPWAAEVLGISRDIILSELTGTPVHIAHVSCAASLDVIRQAKARGLKVTCETAPHYLLFCDQDIGAYNTNFKMNPPLRAEKDMLALRQALNDGTIDAIATDHAPHSQLEKELEFDAAAFGVIGLETALGAMLKLVDEGALSLERMLMLMSINPARILGLPANTLQEGEAADLVLFSPNSPWRVENFRSRSSNSPFLGQTLPGRAIYTVCQGRLTHQPAAQPA